MVSGPLPITCPTQRLREGRKTESDRETEEARQDGVQNARWYEIARQKGSKETLIKLIQIKTQRAPSHLLLTCSFSGQIAIG